MVAENINEVNKTNRTLLSLEVRSNKLTLKLELAAQKLYQTAPTTKIIKKKINKNKTDIMMKTT